MKHLLPLILAVLFIGGCAAASEYTPPQPAEEPSTSVAVEQSYDEAWSDLIQYTSQRFFAIDSYEKESGLMTLTFSSDPVRFVDCGDVKEQGSYEGSYVGWLQQRQETRISLQGRMNLTVNEQSADETRVNANVRYIVTAGAANGQSIAEWTFNTGGSDTQSVPTGAGGTASRTCQPTHEAEQVILDGIREM
jgi:hypothetical protein